MKKYLYKVIEVKRFSKDIEDILNNYAKDGWVLDKTNDSTHDMYFFVILKKEISELLSE